MLQLFTDKIQDGLCLILNFFWKYTNIINPDLRKRLLSCSFMLISICSFCYTVFPISIHLLWKCIVGTFIVFLILIFSIDRELKKVKWNGCIVALWIIFGILRLISGFTASKEFFPLACIWLVAFPALFFVWNNRKDYSVLLEHIYIGLVYPTIIFFVLSILLVPIGSNAYTGLTGNPNAVGEHIAVIFPLVFSRFFLNSTDNKKQKFVNLICIYLCISFAFYSRGRTVTLVIACVVLAGIFSYIFFLNHELSMALKKIAILVIGSVIVLILLIPVNRIATSILPNYSYKSSQQEEKNDTQLDDVITGYLDRVEGKDKAAPGINNYSSGRIGIWKEAISKINLKGNPSSNHIVTVRNGDIGNNVHNVFLQFAYDNGIIAGLIFVFLVIVMLATILRYCVISKRNKELFVILLLITVSYLCEGMVTSINMPFLYVISFVYYMIFSVLFDGELENQ